MKRAAAEMFDAF